MGIFAVPRPQVPCFPRPCRFILSVPKIDVGTTLAFTAYRALTTVPAEKEERGVLRVQHQIYFRNYPHAGFRVLLFLVRGNPQLQVLHLAACLVLV